MDLITSPDRAAWAAALAELKTDAQRARWRADPVAWVTERLGEHPWSKQAEILRSVAANKLTTVQSSHSVGKSWIVSRLVGYYLDNYPPGDFFVVTTAPTWPQVKAIIWRYIGQMAEMHDLPGVVTQDAQWKIGRELVAFGRKPADHNQQGFQGQHGRRGVIAIIDEASGVPNQLWDAIDSMASTAESRIVAVGNPDSVSSRFYQTCTSEPNWNRIKINSFDAPAFTGEAIPASLTGLVDREWVEDKAARWGVNSALYKIKVRGEFAAEDELAVIPLSWVQRAVERWRVIEDDPEYSPVGRTVLGVDVGHLGEDKTVIATRKGDRVLSVESWSKRDTVEVADLTQARCVDWVKPTVVVDGIGVGAGVVDILRNRGVDVTSFIASRATKMRDATGHMRMTNLRAAAWWTLRELLDPAMDGRLALPPDDDLINDLITPRYQVMTGGKIQIESKDDIRKRLGRSTDYADAVVQACFVERYQRDHTDVPPSGRLKALEYADARGWEDY